MLNDTVADVAGFIVWAAFAALMGVAVAESEPEALCATDTECAEFCPPPADDPDCDGGPQ